MWAKFVRSATLTACILTEFRATAQRLEINVISNFDFTRQFDADQHRAPSSAIDLRSANKFNQSY
jgi:hypothetical protein